MAIRLEKTENYILITDTATGEVKPLPNYKIRYKVYNDTVHLIYMDRYADDLQFPFSVLVDSNDVAWADIATLTSWLQRNTGNYKNDFVADETNTVATFLLNGGSEDQTVDGSITPVEFSYSPPAGFELITARIVFYMEGALAFDSNLFGDQAALVNGWTININGVDAMSGKTNRDLGTYMYDMKGDEIYGKTNRTIIGRFSFNKFTDGADGITIREGESFKTIVKDDLTGLTYLEAKIMGVLKSV